MGRVGEPVRRRLGKSTVFQSIKEPTVNTIESIRLNSIGALDGGTAPRLAICIPTYKRPAYLEVCLKSILTAIGDETVPIVISDDSGDDTNAEVIARAKFQSPNVKWYRNEENLGIDRNIMSAVSLCTADYAWLVGEDDLLIPNAVKHVLGVLRTRSPGFLFSNYSYVSNDYRYYLKRRVVDIPGYRELAVKEMIERYSWAMGFIGACIINRGLWCARSDFVGTYYAHVGSILSGVANRTVTMIGEPLVLNRAENARSFSWSANAFDVFFGWEQMLHKLHQTNPAFDLNVAIKNSGILFRHRTIAWLVSKRADGLYDLTTFRSDPRIGEDSKVRRILGFLVALCPRWLCKAAKFAGRDVPRLVQRKRISPGIVSQIVQ